MAVATLLLSLLASSSSAITLPALVFGKGNDFSDPLDGVAEEVLVSISTQDLELNAVADASNPTVQEARGIYEFSVAPSAPSGVSSAILMLPILDAVTAVGNVDVYAYAGNGSLDIADYGELGLLVGTTAVTVPVTSFDVTAEVQSLLGGGASTIGFVIALPAEDQILSIWNPGETPFDPVLEIVPVPEPHALLGVAALGLLARRRRRA